MHKNGFTLIEAIGVIIVIALVSLVTVPLIIKSTDKDRENKQLCEDAKFAMENYIAMKKGSIPSFSNPGDVLEKSLEFLVQEGLLSSSNNKGSENVIVTIQEDYSYQMECTF